MSAPSPRIAFFGMRCTFSAIVLHTLIDAGGIVAGVILKSEAGEATFGDLPLRRRFTKPGAIEAIAQAERIPVRITADPRQLGVIEALTDALTSWRADAIAVACFPWRLPPEALAIPSLGALNVHPSLLPRHRGPDPLFWTFHDDDRWSGATVHEMTGRFDAGPIVTQTPVEVPFGIEGAELEARLAAIGGTLLAQAIARRRLGDFGAVPQDESSASAEGFPSDADLTVPTGRPVRWAFSFVRGIASLGHAATVLVVPTGERVAVERAYAFAPGERLGSPLARENGRVVIQFIDGITEFSEPRLRKPLTLRIDNVATDV